MGFIAIVEQISPHGYILSSFTFLFLCKEFGYFLHSEPPITLNFISIFSTIKSLLRSSSCVFCLFLLMSMSVTDLRYLWKEANSVPSPVDTILLSAAIFGSCCLQLPNIYFRHGCRHLLPPSRPPLGWQNGVLPLCVSERLAVSAAGYRESQCH